MLSNVILPNQREVRNVTHNRLSSIKLRSELVRIAFQLCSDSFAPARKPQPLAEQIRQPTSRIAGIAQKPKTSIIAASEMTLSNDSSIAPLANTRTFALHEPRKCGISNADLLRPLRLLPESVTKRDSNHGGKNAAEPKQRYRNNAAGNNAPGDTAQRTASHNRNDGTAVSQSIRVTRTPSSFICSVTPSISPSVRWCHLLLFRHTISPECCHSLTSPKRTADRIAESIMAVNHASKGSYSILSRVKLLCVPFRHVVCNFLNHNPANGNPGECEFSKPHSCQQPTPVCQTMKKAEHDPARLFSCAQLGHCSGTVRR